MPYATIKLTNGQEEHVKIVLWEAVTSRSNGPKVTIGTRDVEVATIGDSEVLVTSEVRDGWPVTVNGKKITIPVKELSGGTLRRRAVFIAKAHDGLAVATGVIALVKFESHNKHVERYTLEVSTFSDVSEEYADSLFQDTMRALGFAGTNNKATEAVTFDDF